MSYTKNNLYNTTLPTLIVEKTNVIKNIHK